MLDVNQSEGTRWDDLWSPEAERCRNPRSRLTTSFGDRVSFLALLLEGRKTMGTLKMTWTLEDGRLLCRWCDSESVRNERPPLPGWFNPGHLLQPESSSWFSRQRCLIGTQVFDGV